MKFIDEAIITVYSGNGGSGCVSFRREKFIPHGGPDGGDGGKGGDIVLLSTSQKRTLYHFRHKKIFKAQNGSGGQGKKKTGKNGSDIVIEVPTGTIVTDISNGNLLRDLDNPKEKVILLKGGRGGRGNSRFKTATNRTPRFAQPGEPGQSLEIKLELKLLADVGIIGLPNAGKSTLISIISSAKPKIGQYPFTTISPNLGVVQTGYREPFIVADIPGLIEGAHKGVGLGFSFLRHIERTRFLVHLIDISSVKTKDPLASYKTTNQELSLYDKDLLKKPQIVVLNKMDLPDAEEAADAFQSKFENGKIIRISAVTKEGVDRLLSRIVQLIDAFDKKVPEDGE